MSEATAIKTIAIVGSVSAGWMTANLRVARKRHRVVVVESVDIGTLGVGEALTPFFHVFLSHLQYDPLEFVRDVGGSIKLAVRFESAFCSDSEAAAEIEQMVAPKDRGDLGRPIQFRSGTFKETWIKSCVAVGLASG